MSLAARRMQPHVAAGAVFQFKGKCILCGRRIHTRRDASPLPFCIGQMHIHWGWGSPFR